MNTRRQASAAPAQSKSNVPMFEGKEYRSEHSIFPSNRKIFSWQSTEHNTCLAEVAEQETIGDYEVSLDISGLTLSQMYRVLVRSLVAELGKAKTNEDQEFSLICFAARLYAAGRLEGKRPDGQSA